MQFLEAIRWRLKRQNHAYFMTSRKWRIYMTHKLKTETFSQKIEHSGGVIVLPLTPLFSFFTFHLNYFLILDSPNWET